MANPKRGNPDCFVTSITPLLAGEAFCEYQPWYRARFWVRNTSGEFDRAGWIAEHAAMVRAREKELIAEGWTVAVEKQNTYSLIGKTARFSGTPDLLAHRTLILVGDHDKYALVSDVKTGKRKLAHYWQVMAYMLTLPKVRPDLAGYTLSGELCYKDGRIEIRPEELTPEAVGAIWGALRDIGFQMPPGKTPSEQECDDCPIPVTECPDKATVTRAVGDTDEF